MTEPDRLLADAQAPLKPSLDVLPAGKGKGQGAMSALHQEASSTAQDMTTGSSLLAAGIAAALGAVVGVGSAFGTAVPAALLPFKVSAASLILVAIVTIVGRGSSTLFVTCMGAVA